MRPTPRPVTQTSFTDATIDRKGRFFYVLEAVGGSGIPSLEAGPVEVNRAPAIERPRWEPRPKWPRASGCAAPYVPVKGECGTRLELEVRHLEGRKHLPIFGLRKAA